MTAAVVAEARRWIGTPYVHQASVCGVGTDCLGLLRGVWRALQGPEPQTIPAYTLDWGEVRGDEALIAAGHRWMVAAGPVPEAGDVLVFRMRDGAVAKHIGILADTGAMPTFVHAYSGHGVVESPFSEPWARRVAARFAFPLHR